MEIQSIVSAGEGQRVEFKTSFASQNEIIETLGALTNADGGVVFVGIKDDGAIVGTHIGSKTLEDFANRLAAESDPQLLVSIETKEINGKKVVSISVGSARPGEVFYTFGRPKIRVGKINRTMSPTEQRARLLEGQDVWSEERDRPRFEFLGGSFSNWPNEFELRRRIKQVAGDYIQVIEWRFRGPKLQPPMDWQQVNATSFDRPGLAAIFSKSSAIGEDVLIPDDQLGIEVRFHWRGKLRTELHRYAFTNWELGREVLPSLYIDG